MDGIPAHRGTTTPAPIRQGRDALALEPHAQHHAHVVPKTTGDYISALRRRIWMVLSVAVPIAVGGSILVLKMPAVYMAKAEVEIRPPEIDPHLSTLVGRDVGRETGSGSQFVANHQVWLKSAWLAQAVVTDPAISPLVSHVANPAFDLFKSLAVLQIGKSTTFQVTLEGTDPVLTKTLLEQLLAEFRKRTRDEISDKLAAVKSYAQQDLVKLRDSQKQLEDEIVGTLQKTKLISATGRSLAEERYVMSSNMIAQKQSRLGEVAYQLQLAKLFPKFDMDGGGSPRLEKLAQLEAQARRYRYLLEDARHNVRQFNSDRSVRRLAELLDETLDEIETLRNVKTEMASTPTDLIVEEFKREVEAERDEHEKLLGEMQEAVPDLQKVQMLFADRAERAKQVARMQERITEFEILEQSLLAGDPVRIPREGVAEPTAPVKPNRPLFIALVLFLSLGTGVGLVCLLEHVDRTVRVPEHVTHGLGLPLLGVVPRMRRTALTQRGGHLWARALPNSLEADAYRNIRAGLLGVGDRRDPIVTLLVTSAQIGEGKSTTSLNLAAACASAGERTLLIDVDLRRPSLAEALIDDEPLEDVHGLVDVLRGDLPWNSTVRPTDLANLDFMPAGDPRDVPIEILGTLELKELLLELAGCYDRVILDGPAVLGLADCRVLGRLVDAAVVVVRSGSHELMTLHRAKSMLEMSRVSIAGVVFNGLTDAMDDWASYGYEPMGGLALGSAVESREAEPAGAAQG